MRLGVSSATRRRIEHDADTQAIRGDTCTDFVNDSDAIVAENDGKEAETAVKDVKVCAANPDLRNANAYFTGPGVRLVKLSDSRTANAVNEKRLHRERTELRAPRGADDSAEIVAWRRAQKWTRKSGRAMTIDGTAREPYANAGDKVRATPLAVVVRIGREKLLTGRNYLDE